MGKEKQQVEKVQGEIFCTYGARSLRQSPLYEFLPSTKPCCNALLLLSCSRWAAPMSAKLYVLISWPDGSRVINIENIKEPRKPFHLYTVGEQVLARCPGFSGLYWGMVEGISGE